ncbi:SCO family protein [Arachidicoccus sp.]|uniref:SCO family protein n=1 Tax=Arachidicoccus sp. TaxID=1872624 RepID=UPI003D1DC3EC
MNWKKFLFYAGFFVVVFIVFLFFTFRGNDNWKTRLPVLSTVQPFSFITQSGKTFTNQDISGKVCVVNYFFTTCHGICPRMNSNMKKIYEQFKDNPDFRILSHTCMPEIDSAAVLKHYADSMDVNTNTWVFLTGRKDSLYNAARNSYLLDDNKNSVQNIKDQFIHTQFFALVDKDGNVRGEIFDGLKKVDLDKLKEDIVILLKEKQGGRNNFANNIFGNNM